MVTVSGFIHVAAAARRSLSSGRRKAPCSARWDDTAHSQVPLFVDSMLAGLTSTTAVFKCVYVCDAVFYRRAAAVVRLGGSFKSCS